MKTKVSIFIFCLLALLIPFISFANSSLAERLSGRILLQVEEKGEAYYINPVDLKMYFLDRPADAFVIMRNFGLGITNNDLNKISYFNYFFQIHKLIV